jgi:hypothetical protein
VSCTEIVEHKPIRGRHGQLKYIRFRCQLTGAVRRLRGSSEPLGPVHSRRVPRRNRALAAAGLVLAAAVVAAGLVLASAPDDAAAASP